MPQHNNSATNLCCSTADLCYSTIHVAATYAAAQSTYTEAQPTYTAVQPNYAAAQHQLVLQHSVAHWFILCNCHNQYCYEFTCPYRAHAASFICLQYIWTSLEQQMDQTWGAGSIQIVGDNQLGAQTNDSSIVSVTLPSLTPLPDQSTVPHHQPSVTVVGPDLVVNSTQLAGPPVHNSMTAHNLTTAPSPEMSVRDTLDCSQELPNQSNETLNTDSVSTTAVQSPNICVESPSPPRGQSSYVAEGFSSIVPPLSPVTPQQPNETHLTWVQSEVEDAEGDEDMDRAEG